MDEREGAGKETGWITGYHMVLRFFFFFILHPQKVRAAGHTPRFRNSPTRDLHSYFLFHVLEDRIYHIGSEYHISFFVYMSLSIYKTFMI